MWKDTIDHLQSDHVIYAVTLAGFDGTPPPAAGNYTNQAVASLSVDAPPVFPGTRGFTPAQRPKVAEELRAEFASMTAAKLAEQQVEEMQQAGDVLDPVLAKQLGALQARNDPRAVGQYIAGDVNTDLRPDLGKITVPLLEICRYNPADFHGGSGKMSETRKANLDKTLLKDAPDAHVVSISPVRHFVMYDQPVKFHATPVKSLATLLRL